jgi:hypothetical protein
VAYDVAFDTPVIGEEHPVFSDSTRANSFFYYVDVLGNAHGVDWSDLNGFDDHLTTAHFNVFLNAEEMDGGASYPVTPTVERLGLMECTYATLARWMTSPLAEGALFSEYGEYADLTRIPLVIGGDPNTPSGGGVSQPLGVGYRRRARENAVGQRYRFGQYGNTTDYVSVHELFHVFDYAGNPLHSRYFDQRYQANAYHFYHEGPARIEQTMAPKAYTMWGYRTDFWPSWAPLDLGLFELDYDAGPFWPTCSTTLASRSACGRVRRGKARPSTSAIYTSSETVRAMCSARITLSCSRRGMAGCGN